jgi:hypothetical protein
LVTPNEGGGGKDQNLFMKSVAADAYAASVPKEAIVDIVVFFCGSNQLLSLDCDLLRLKLISTYFLPPIN